MSFKTKKVSDHDIVVEKSTTEKIPVKGQDWFEEPFSNIFLLAKKKTGKTTTIKNILRRTAGKNTKFIFIVSTIEKDPTWKSIVNYWEDKGNEVITFDDIKDDGNDVIKDFLESNKIQEEPIVTKVITKKRDPKVPITYQNGGSNKEEKISVEQPEEKKKVKLVYPEYIIVLDDLGEAMRNKSLTQLLKTNRHYKTKVILSAQNITDLMPAAIRQLDYVLAFGRIPLDKIEKLREDLMVDLSDEDFKKLYEDATNKPHQFLYIGRLANGDIFRKGFTEQYEIE
jgi:hypothetical protein